MRRSFVILLLGALLPAGCLGTKPSLHLVDAVVEADVVWQGEVRIRGVVTVKKQGRVVILPGTKIVFEPVDRDGDGIGDSELLVEGALLARGTAEAPILFTSGAAEPKPQDWKYLYFDFAKEAVLEHVVSEYAYSGVQVHFCRATVRDSVFRYNVDGVRFSTVNIEVAGNRMIHNTHGLRYEERGSVASVHHNDIRNNDIGIFAVTRSKDKATIARNNLVDNRNYSVKLGIEQREDVTLPYNWWGTTDGEQIAAGILDRRIDPQLGRVLTPAPLTGPVDISRWREEKVP
ncbi:MAG: hypothetical protein C0616_07295 [Desulfuromonas sp.]|nr:MAG: hypothetical protein C0616_07295 [Desulfuromonas sp.]